MPKSSSLSSAQKFDVGLRVTGIIVTLAIFFIGGSFSGSVMEHFAAEKDTINIPGSFKLYNDGEIYPYGVKSAILRFKISGVSTMECGCAPYIAGVSSTDNCREFGWADAGGGCGSTTGANCNSNQIVCFNWVGHTPTGVRLYCQSSEIMYTCKGNSCETSNFAYLIPKPLNKGDMVTCSVDSVGSGQLTGVDLDTECVECNICPKKWIKVGEKCISTIECLDPSVKTYNSLEECNGFVPPEPWDFDWVKGLIGVSIPLVVGSVLYILVKSKKKRKR